MALPESLTLAHVRWRPFLARGGRIARVIRNLTPLTVRGVLLAGVAGLALGTLGYGSLDLVSFVLGMAGLVLPALSLLATTACAAVLYRRLRRIPPAGPRRLAAAAAQPTGFAVKGFALVPLVRVRWTVSDPAGIEVKVDEEEGELRERVRAMARCQVGALTRAVTVGDVFGLAALSWTAREETPLTVLPDVGHIRRLPVLVAVAGGEAEAHTLGHPEGDRMDIRAYAPGDSVRNILWKAYARTGEVNVRVRERAIMPTPRLVAYLLAGEDDEASAACARVAVEHGLLGPRWVFGADGADGPCETLDRALLAIARSGNRPGGERPPCGLAAFLAGQLGSGGVRCVVFMPPRPGPWLDMALACARRHPQTLSFVVGTDGVRDDVPRARWRRLVERPADDPRPTAGELNRVLRAIAAMGSPSVVVDRRDGRSYSQLRDERLGQAS